MRRLTSDVIEIFRGRYLKSFAQPAPLKAGKVVFPLYDRNPQTYIDNIMYAKPGDYRKATQSIWFGGANASAVALPVVP